ncbi:MAG: WecB/TagA/CpsF family glycosyltransferase [Balneolia bacterium]|nr:WecB/TagA/CpsF family glycosyltransferase [Balneolia bacterium]
MSAQRFNILGVPISAHSRDEFYREINQKLAESQEKTSPLFVVTVNPEIATHTIYDDEFRHILNQSQINTADGVGISWAVKHIYRQQVERITGSDSLEEICRLSAENNQSVFFYGAAPGVATKAADILKQRIENLAIAGTYSPDKPDLTVENLPRSTQDALRKASVVFVALGAPAQEKWIYNNMKFLDNCRVIIGIGGSFDFIAGTVKRAPAAFRKTGTEWLYRLWLQPSRWRRMMKLPLFAINVILLRSDLQTQNQGRT